MKKRLPPPTRPPERSGAAEVRINSAATPSLAGRSADSGPYGLITAEYNLGGWGGECVRMCVGTCDSGKRVRVLL